MFGFIVAAKNSPCCVFLTILKGKRQQRRVCYCHRSSCSGARGSILRGTRTSFFCRRSTRCKHFRRRDHVSEIQQRDSARSHSPLARLRSHTEHPAAQQTGALPIWREINILVNAADVNMSISRVQYKQHPISSSSILTHTLSPTVSNTRGMSWMQSWSALLREGSRTPCPAGVLFEI